MKKVVLIVLITALISSAVSMYVYHRYFAVKLITVDLIDFYSKQKDRYVEGKVDNEWLKKKTDELAEKLRSYPKNTVFLTSDVVLRDYPKKGSIPTIVFRGDKWIEKR